jgi:hypothetical protein
MARSFLLLFLFVASAAFSRDVRRAELPETRALNQRTSPECYLNAFLGALETRNLKFHPTAPVFSADYLFARKLEKWGSEAIWYGDSDELFFDLRGGHFHEALSESRASGLVPVEFYKPPRPIETWDLNGLYDTLSRTTRDWNRYLVGLRQTYSAHHPKVVEGFHRGISVVQTTVREMAGAPIPSFERKGRIWTPHQVEARYGIDRGATLYTSHPEGRWDYADRADMIREYQQATGGKYSIAPASFDQMGRDIITWIDANEPVVVDLKWAPGVAHTMVITGYETVNGKLSRFKLKNSWGESWGVRGYEWYDAAWVKERLMGTHRIGVPAK